MKICAMNLAIEPRKWFQYITVEPTMFFYMFAFQLTSVIEQAFFVYKACRVNHNYSSEICDHITDANYTDIKAEVQITVSNFHQWNSIAGHIFPIVIAMFIGSWSDRRGRKIPLLIGLTGKLIYVLGILLNVYFEDWPVEYIIYTATLPSALTGVDIVIFAAAFAYIADITSVENRTSRVTVLEVTYLITFPTGIALGSYMFNRVVNRSYWIMFSINATFLVAAIVYSLLRLKWLTSDKQRPLTDVSGLQMFSDFFDQKHVADSLKTLCKPRTMRRRMYLWIFLLAMMFYTFQRDERQYTYLYTQYKFHWGTEQFSSFKVFQSVSQILCVFCGIHLMTKLLKWQDTVIAMVGAVNFTLARMFFAFAEVEWVFYVGGFIAGLGPVTGPVLRSITSKVVGASERGKVYALLAVCDNSVPLISGVIYTQVYNLTYGIFPGIFWLTAFTQMILFGLMLTVHISLNGQPIAVQDADVQETTNIANDASASHERIEKNSQNECLQPNNC